MATEATLATGTELTFQSPPASDGLRWGAHGPLLAGARGAEIDEALGALLEAPAEEGGEHLVKGGSVFELSHVNSTPLSELDKALSPAELGAWINAFKKPIKVTLVPEGAPAPAPAPAPNEEPAKASLGGNFALPDKKDTAPKMPCVCLKLKLLRLCLTQHPLPFRPPLSGAPAHAHQKAAVRSLDPRSASPRFR